MFKIVLAIKRKPGLSRQEFIDAYENSMVPLINRRCGKYMSEYKRNYPIENDPYGFGPAGEAGFDVFTEFLVKDRQSLDELFAVVNSPDVGSEIGVDADRFIDMRSAWRYITEVYPEGAR